jgi:hypothetical protein
MTQHSFLCPQGCGEKIASSAETNGLYNMPLTFTSKGRISFRAMKYQL